jgi:predicted ATPase/class 3 adenylate cyclase
VPRELPSGTVTFLFTDIEGSTRLLHELGSERYAQALAEHRRVIREACGDHSGVEVDTQGDAFFVAFTTAPAAIAAATRITTELEGGPIHVRIGIHTGTPHLTDEGYVGPDVHRAARIAAAAHGGQVLVSGATAALLEGHLRDMGEHRLKDLSAPERIYQIGDAEFPRLKTLFRTNAPVPATPFVGRQRELSDVRDLLLREDVRLLTLTGAGGTGKTRLALQAAADAAERYPDGVWWIPLATVRDPQLITSAIAQTLDVMEEPGTALSNALARSLEGRQTLLVVDNVEHLLPAAGRALSELAAVRGVQLLVTSRQRLDVAGEQLYPVPTLDRRDAVALFLARARALQPEFSGNGSITELCARLDYLPLALELAAARTVVFTTDQLLERLVARLDLLKGGPTVDPRQRTLRATIEWSHALLDRGEQRLFRSLSIFAGGCTYEAAEAIADAEPESLQSLIDKSLVRRRADGDGEPRYWMLETIREYAAERAAVSDTADALADRHGEHFLELAERAEPDLWRYVTEWLPRFDAELPNIRSALEWALRQDDAQVAYRLAGALYPYWELRGQHGEARRWLARVLECDVDVSPTLRVKALTALGRATALQGDRARALPILEEAAALGRRLGDDEAVGRCLGFIGHAYLFRGDGAKALEVLEEGVELARRSGDARSLVRAIGNAAAAALELPDFDRARAMYGECVEIARAERFTVSAAIFLTQLGATETLAGNFDAAEELLNEARAMFADLGETTWTHVPVRYAGVNALMRGHIDEAEQLLLTSLASGRDLSPGHDLAWSIENLAAVADAKDDDIRAATLWGATDALFEQSNLAVLEESKQVRARYRRDRLDMAAYGRGKAMTLDETIDFALGAFVAPPRAPSRPRPVGER